MRQHELAPSTRMKLVVIPFTCKATFPVAPNRDKIFCTAATVCLGRTVIEDVDVQTIRYTRDGQSIETNLTGTLVVFTAKGIKDAIDRANASQIRINGLGMQGTGKIIAFEIGETVTLIDPISGDTFTLKGANR